MTKAVDDLFADVDPGRRVQMVHTLPSETLETFAENYRGEQDKDSRMRAFAALLSEHEERERANNPQPPSRDSEQVSFKDTRALVYAEINDWPQAHAAWGDNVRDFYGDAGEDLDFGADDGARPKRRRVAALWNYACALRSTARYAEAESMFRRVMAIDKADPGLGESSEDYARDLCAVMSVVGAQEGRKGETKALYDELQTVLGKLDEEQRAPIAQDAQRDWNKLLAAKV